MSESPRRSRFVPVEERSAASLWFLMIQGLFGLPFLLAGLWCLYLVADGWNWNRTTCEILDNPANRELSPEDPNSGKLFVQLKRGGEVLSEPFSWKSEADVREWQGFFEGIGYECWYDENRPRWTRMRNPKRYGDDTFFMVFGGLLFAGFGGLAVAAALKCARELFRRGTKIDRP